MNSKLEQFARAEIKKELAQCTLEQQLIFKRMYSHKNLELPIDEAVDAMPSDKLNWAIQQVERTVNNNNARKEA